MDTQFAIELLVWGMLFPAVISMAILCLARQFLPERYGVGAAFAVAAFSGYVCLDWAKLVPERHYQWLPWLPLLCFIPLAMSLARNMHVAERIAVFLPVSAATAYFIVPTWSRLAETRWTYLLIVGGVTWLLCCVLDFIASRTKPAWFIVLMTLCVGGVAGILMPFLSLKFGQMILAAAGASTGVGLLSLRSDLHETGRAIAPLLAVVLTSGVFIGFVDPDPPMYPLLLPLAAPLVLLPFVLGPLREKRGVGKSVLQFVLVAALLGGSAFWINAEQAEKTAGEYGDYASRSEPIR